MTRNTCLVISFLATVFAVLSGCEASSGQPADAQTAGLTEAVALMADAGKADAPAPMADAGKADAPAPMADAGKADAPAPMAGGADAIQPEPGGAGGAPADASSQRKGTVARIVFIDKEDCCECTRARTDATWTALEGSLGTASIPVERIHIDTQADKAKPYLEKNNLMVIPGVFFVDKQGNVLEMLQGEVTGEQFARALSAPD